MGPDSAFLSSLVDPDGDYHLTFAVEDGEILQHFVRAAYAYERLRRRDGAELFRDLSRSNIYLEVFLVSSWEEHLRWHERQTAVDRKFENALLNTLFEKPIVTHIIYAEWE